MMRKRIPKILRLSIERAAILVVGAVIAYVLLRLNDRWQDFLEQAALMPSP